MNRRGDHNPRIMATPVKGFGREAAAPAPLG
jgi:hypothetical protein